jgi:hypothetical protein
MEWQAPAHYQIVNGLLPIASSPEAIGTAERACTALVAGFKALDDLYETRPPAVQLIVANSNEFAIMPLPDTPQPLFGNMICFPYCSSTVEPSAIIIPCRPVKLIVKRVPSLCDLLLWRAATQIALNYIFNFNPLGIPMWLGEIIFWLGTVEISYHEGKLLTEAIIGMHDGREVPAISSYEKWEDNTVEMLMGLYKQILALAVDLHVLVDKGLLLRIVNLTLEQPGRDVQSILAEAIGTGGWEWLKSHPSF